MEIDAEPSKAGDAIRRIGDLHLAILLQRVAWQRGDHSGFDFRTVEQARLDFAHLAVDAHARWRTGYQQQVARAALNDHGEPAVEPLGDARIAVLRFLFPVEMIQAGGVIHHRSTCWERLRSLSVNQAE